MATARPVIRRPPDSAHPPPPHRRVPLLRRHALAAVVAGLGGVVAVCLHLAVFASLSGNADEATYLLQGEALAHGSLTIPVGERTPPGMEGPVGFLQPWLTGQRDGSYFTKYPPGYPALIALSLLVADTPVGALAVGAGCWLLGTYAFAHVLCGSRRTALLAAAFVAFSPLFVIHGALYLSYAFSCGLLFGGAAAVLHAARCQGRGHGHPRCPGRWPRWGWALLGGALWGAVLLVRPYDVVLLALPVLAYALVEARRSWGHAACVLTGVALGALPFLAALLAYDQRVTGRALLLPLAAADPLDAMGFGTRRIMPTEPTKDFTVEMAWTALGRYLAAVPDWTFAGLAVPAVAAVGLLARRHGTGSRLVLAALLVIVPLGYFPFWGMVISSDLLLPSMGPVYFLPALTALAVAAAWGAVAMSAALWNRAPARARPSVALALAGALSAGLAVSVRDVGQAIAHQDVATEQAEAIADGIPPASALRTPAVVLVTTPAQQPYVGTPYQSLRNPYPGASLSAEWPPLVYAASHGASDVLVDQALPRRAVYGLRVPETPQGSRPPTPSFVPLTKVSGERLRVDVTAPSTTAGSCLAAFLVVGGVRHEKPVTCSRPPGLPHRAEWELNAAEIRRAVTGEDAPPTGAQLLSDDRPSATTWLVAGFAVAPSPSPATHGERQRSWWAAARIVEQRMSLAVHPGDGAGLPQGPVSVLTPGVDWLGVPQPAPEGSADGHAWTMPAGPPELQVRVTAHR